MNNCNFTGRLTRDPELKFLASGTPICEFTVAVDMGKDKAGAKQTEFIDMKAFNKTAEIIGKYFNKGKEIAVTGKFRTDKWEDKETGQKRSRVRIVVDQFSFIGGGGSKDGQGARERGPDAVPAEPEMGNDDEIPF